ncbi:MAG: hypothetical protein ABH867_04570 [Patescibacteria group bacterium]|nr:hypothetical protein [Patescibacteria group bacterium]
MTSRKEKRGLTLFNVGQGVAPGKRPTLAERRRAIARSRKPTRVGIRQRIKTEREEREKCGPLPTCSTGRSRTPVPRPPTEEEERLRRIAEEEEEAGN